jgi:hypothetical protein
MRQAERCDTLLFWIEHSAFGKWQWNRRPLIMNQRQDTKRYWSSYLGMSGLL